MASSRSSARQRLLESARDLFYRKGIRSIGVDTIAEQSGVGKPTLYRHFSTKDKLISAYLEEENRLHWQWFEEAIAPYQASAKAQLVAVIDATAQLLAQPGYRGCAFLNALAEFSEEDHPAHRQAIEFKHALRLRLYQLSQQAGAHDPDALADQLLLAINGALASAPLFGPSGPAAQLRTITTYLIDLQCENTQEKP
ncbi:TetR family transcriptional regulator [Reticulibacter mediterranei]|uniref:TetR family transcriptional regulator n=1 Tax=Reticulibacter mediterranei TaxID=2778369 RepID=A0A8J3J0A1_9CHLR|nr:TetR/AcrR family transcriptional regulator [Reticulibacter mediterranei]GHO99990.1 TetR family transcriptional regulator [Reticulibacter mediterranei]